MLALGAVLLMSVPAESERSQVESREAVLAADQQPARTAVASAAAVATTAAPKLARTAAVEPAAQATAPEAQDAAPPAAPAKTALLSVQPDADRFARDAVQEPARRKSPALAALSMESGKAEDDRSQDTTGGIARSAFAAEVIRPEVPDEVGNEAEAAEQDEAGRETRVASSVNLRAGPGNGKKVLGTLPAGASVTMFDCNRGWCEVASEHGRGFIAAKFVGQKPAARKVKSKKRAQPAAGATQAAAAKPADKDLPGVFADPLSRPNNR